MTNSVFMSADVGGDGKLYTDGVGDNDVTSRGMDGGGHALWFIPLVSAVIRVATYVKDTLVAAAAGYAAAAAASAASAVNAPGTSATSSTNSVALGTGSKTLTIQTGKSIVRGMNILAADAADGTKQMAGPVDSYNSATGVLVFDSQYASAATTPAGWVVSLTAPIDSTLTGRVTTLEVAAAKQAPRRLFNNKDMF